MDCEKFRQNAAINRLAKLPYWTLTQLKDKMPIDINKFIEYVQTQNDIPAFFYGATTEDGNNPFMECDDLQNALTVDLKEALDRLYPNSNHTVDIGPMTFRMTSRTQPFVILDIEPKASEEIKQKFLNTKFLYCETSMSGHGYHMVFESRDILNKYPNAAIKPALKSKDGAFEILVNHYVTFTGENIIEPVASDDSYFYEVFEQLASEAKPPVPVLELKTDADVSGIFKADYLLQIVKPTKTFESYANDAADKSRQEFSFICHLTNQLLNAIEPYSKIHEYTDDELASLLYAITKKYLPPRNKHIENRAGITWLEHEVQTALSYVINERKEDNK